MLAVLLCTLSGTLFLYQGQEIGMYNFPESWTIEDIRDIDSLNSYDEVKAIHDGHPLWLKKAMRGIQKIGRDNARTPVQWDDSANGGFTTGKPWMRVHDNYAKVNVANQLRDSNSPLAFWRKALSVRKEYQSLTTFGGFAVHDYNEVDTFTYTKTDKEGRAMLVILNFSSEEQPWDIPPALKDKKLKPVIANVDHLGEALSPWEARVYLAE